jgi:RNA polymerase sigma-70 factor (ECF subfamily)
VIAVVDFWRSSGWHLLDRRDDGHHVPSDDFLRAYLLRPELAPVDDDFAAEGTAEDAASDSDRRELVHRAVRSLPPKYRDPLVLFYFHEQDVAATARSLGLPEGTVKARLSRGRDLLESKLERRL